MTRAAVTKRSGFKPESKLRSAAEFDRVRQDGRRVGDAFFSLQYLANSLGRPRLGMAVSLRSTGNAVTRNRVRRVVRESFRLRQHELPACDLFVTARSAAREASNAVMFASLERLWRRVPLR